MLGKGEGVLSTGFAKPWNGYSFMKLIKPQQWFQTDLCLIDKNNNQNNYVLSALVAEPPCIIPETNGAGSFQIPGGGDRPCAPSSSCWGETVCIRSECKNMASVLMHCAITYKLWDPNPFPGTGACRCQHTWEFKRKGYAVFCTHSSVLIFEWLKNQSELKVHLVGLL